MPKKSITNFRPTGIALERRFFSDEDIDRIIKAGRGLQESKVPIDVPSDDATCFGTVSVDRRTALIARLETAAQWWHVKSQFQKKPTGKQRAEQFEKIEAAANRLLKALDLPLQPSEGEPLETMPEALRRGGLQAFAAEEAVRLGGFPEFTGEGLLEGDVAAVYRLRDWARAAKERYASAEHSIWVSTFAFFDGPKAFDALARRMDARPDLHVTLLLNIQRKRGDTTAVDHLVRKFADRFWGTDWPGSSRPAVYYDPRSLDLDGPAGVLHAKAIVADDEVVFVTSANLTEAALDRNIEVGLLVHDRALAVTLSTHFRVLIDRGLLLPLPMA